MPQNPSSSTAPQNSKSSSTNWRTQVQQTQLVSQVPKILLQRKSNYWGPLLKTTLKLSKLTPSLFLQILQKTQNSPQISLNFFNWAKKNLDFQPDLKSQCKLTHILSGSGLSIQAKPILDLLVQSYPSTEIVGFLCKGADSNIYSPLLYSVLECYCNRGLFLEALNVYRKGKELGDIVVSAHGCNTLLNLLQDKNAIRLAWCFYASMIRNGVLGNQFTWSIIVRILYKDGKFETIVRILGMGIYNSLMYNLIIDCCSERGDFDAAFGYLEEARDRKLDPSFSTYSSILDGACKHQDDKVIDMVMGYMVEKGYIKKCVTKSEYDSIIHKLSELGKTYAAGLFLQRASSEKIELQDATYGSILRALSNKSQVRDAIGIYFIVSERKMIVRYSCYSAFVKVLCKQIPSKEICELIKDVIGKGFHPPVSELSMYTKSVCDRCRWKEAEDLLNLILDRGLLLDPSCYCSLVKHYCSKGQIDSAIILHSKTAMLNGTFDVKTYSILLSELFKQRKVEGALGLFDYMRMHKVMGTESFTIMIRELCHVKELRKAMKLHDEMLDLGLKPEVKKYKQLISAFG